MPCPVQTAKASLAINLFITPAVLYYIYWLFTRDVLGENAVDVQATTETVVI